MTSNNRVAIPPNLKKDLSIRLIVSYALDWIVLVIFVVVAGVFQKITPNKRPFSLYDPNISFPHADETIPDWLLVVLIALVPAICIAAVSLLFVPGPTVPRNTPAALVWKRKLWELHAGWLGLALSVISAFWFTQGMKNMFGKPRPDLLARCDPDFDNRDNYRVGGFMAEASAAQLFSADICRQTDDYLLNDGFRSFPSGHSSTSAAGLVYFTLYLASKLSLTIPFVSSTRTNHAVHSAFPSRVNTLTPNSKPLHGSPSFDLTDSQPSPDTLALRRQAAAPPLYLLVVVLVPFCLSVFISATRFYDFRHFGFDILFGYLMGLICAVLSFRYYHLPIQEGAGWAWGPRGEDRAFWAGVGNLGFAGAQRFSSSRADQSLDQSNGIDGPRFNGQSAYQQRPTASHTVPAHGFQRTDNVGDVEMQAVRNRI